MERTNTFEPVFVLLGKSRDGNVATFGVDHSVNSRAVDPEADANTGTDGDVCDVVFDVSMTTIIKLKLCQNIAISVEGYAEVWRLLGGIDA